MAFVAEDGTGLSTANSLVTVEFADAYFTDRGITAWTGSNTVKQQALIKATDYVEGRFGTRVRGSKLKTDQALCLPTDAFDGVPVKAKQAICEYALRALTATLAPDPEVQANGFAVKSKKEKLGPLEEVTEYHTERLRDLFKPYPAADMLLKTILRPAGLVRV